MIKELLPLLSAIAEQYQLSPEGPHGLAHWGRVLENGLALAEPARANPRVVALFAIFHDACRLNDQRDPGHGARGAQLASKLLSGTNWLSPREFELLQQACRDHTAGHTEAKPTIQVCWDADRLDLARVGIQPDPVLLCTPAAQDPDLIRWASQRARTDHHPDFVRREWLPAFRIC
jgi:uncharacterized protein